MPTFQNPISNHAALTGGAGNTIVSVAPSTSGNVLTSDGTDWTSAPAPGAGLLSVSGALTNSQIKALHGTPVQLLAAPGSGKIIQIVSTIATMQYGGSNVFTAAAGQTIALSYGITVTILNLLANAQITPSTSTLSIANVGTSNSSFSSCTNTAVNLYNPAATEITGNAANDNTISYNIIYRIVTIP